MSVLSLRSATAALLFCVVPVATFAQPVAAPPGPASDSADAMVRTMVARLDFERYKATIKGLTAFGDRRQGTDRNRQAVDWIEAQLKSYGCTNTERITYDYSPPAPVAHRPSGAKRVADGRAACARAPG
jgi:hypothetical protein